MNWLIPAIMYHMKSILVGAFEAKTHFGQLLNEVENGAEVHITRHGRPVAIMRAERAAETDEARAALQRLATHRRKLSREEIRDMVNDGRER